MNYTCMICGRRLRPHTEELPKGYFRYTWKCSNERCIPIKSEIAQVTMFYTVSEELRRAKLKESILLADI